MSHLDVVKSESNRFVNSSSTSDYDTRNQNVNHTDMTSYGSVGMSDGSLVSHMQLTDTLVERVRRIIMMDEQVSPLAAFVRIEQGDAEQLLDLEQRLHVLQTDGMHPKSTEEVIAQINQLTSYIATLRQAKEKYALLLQDARAVLQEHAKVRSSTTIQEKISMNSEIVVITSQAEQQFARNVQELLQQMEQLQQDARSITDMQIRMQAKEVELQQLRITQVQLDERMTSSNSKANHAAMLAQLMHVLGRIQQIYDCESVLYLAKILQPDASVLSNLPETATATVSTFEEQRRLQLSTTDANVPSLLATSKDVNHPVVLDYTSDSALRRSCLANAQPETDKRIVFDTMNSIQFLAEDTQPASPASSTIYSYNMVINETCSDDVLPVLLMKIRDEQRTSALNRDIVVISPSAGLQDRALVDSFLFDDLAPRLFADSDTTTWQHVELHSDADNTFVRSKRYLGKQRGALSTDAGQDHQRWTFVRVCVSCADEESAGVFRRHLQDVALRVQHALQNLPGVAATTTTGDELWNVGARSAQVIFSAHPVISGDTDADEDGAAKTSISSPMLVFLPLYTLSTRASVAHCRAKADYVRAFQTTILQECHKFSGCVMGSTDFTHMSAQQHQQHQQHQQLQQYQLHESQLLDEAKRLTEAAQLRATTAETLLETTRTQQAVDLDKAESALKEATSRIAQLELQIPVLQAGITEKQQEMQQIKDEHAQVIADAQYLEKAAERHANEHLAPQVIPMSGDSMPVQLDEQKAKLAAMREEIVQLKEEREQLEAKAHIATEKLKSDLVGRETMLLETQRKVDEMRVAAQMAEAIISNHETEARAREQAVVQLMLTKQATTEAQKRAQQLEEKHRVAVLKQKEAAVHAAATMEQLKTMRRDLDAAIHAKAIAEMSAKRTRHELDEVKKHATIKQAQLENEVVLAHKQFTEAQHSVAVASNDQTHDKLSQAAETLQIVLAKAGEVKQKIADAMIHTAGIATKATESLNTATELEREMGEVRRAADAADHARIMAEKKLRQVSKALAAALVEQQRMYDMVSDRSLAIASSRHTTIAPVPPPPPPPKSFQSLSKLSLQMLPVPVVRSHPDRKIDAGIENTPKALTKPVDSSFSHEIKSKYIVQPTLPPAVTHTR